MEHAVTRDGGATVVSFEGDIDLESSPEARRVLLDCVGRGGRVLVVLERVTYIDSSGVASLVEAFQRARRSHVDFALVSARRERPAVRAFLDALASAECREALEEAGFRAAPQPPTA